MKKYLAILLALLLLPAVLAEEGTQTKENNETEKSNMHQKQTDELRKDRMEQTRQRVQEARGVAKDVRDMKKDMRENIKEQHTIMMDMRKSLDACKGQQTDECKEKRKEGKQTAKTTLAQTADDVITMLTSTKERLAASTLANKDALIADIDKKIEAITTAKTNIQALTDNSTKEEIKTAAKTLRETLMDAKHSIKKSTFGVAHTRLGKAVETSKNLVERFDKALAKLKEKGVDVSSANAESFKTQVAKAESLNAEAKSLFEQAQAAEPGQKDELMKQATEKLRMAQQALKDAHGMLKDLMASLRKMNAPLDEATP